MDKEYKYERNREYQYENNRVPKKGRRRKKKKKNRALKIIFRIIVILIILIVVAVGVLVGYVYNKLSKIDYQEGGLDNVEINEGVETKGYLNIALFGIDARSNEYNGGSGSDCILIVSIDEKTKEVKMSSIYRDSYLCYENNKYTKITDIYRRFGPQKTVSVLNRNLDLDISEYVTINFEVVAEVVNYIGGVQVTIGKADLKYINSYIDESSRVTGIKSSHITKAGTYNLDGIQALAYARIRYVGTDVDRAARQREILNKTFDKVKKMNAVKINGLVDKVLPKVKTTLSNSEIINLALGVTQYNISGSTGFPENRQDYKLEGIYYMVPKNLEENVKILHQQLFNEEDYKVSNDLKKISDNLITKTGIK